MTEHHDNKARGAGGRRRSTLQRKLVLWTVALVSLPTFFCAAWLTVMTRTALERNQGQAVSVVAQTAAVALAGRVSEPLGPEGRSVIEGLALDKRLSFLLVVDAEFKPIHLRVIDDHSWGVFAQWQKQAGRAAMGALQRPIVLGREQNLTAWRAPIWEPPLPDRGSLGAGERKLMGFVILAMHDPTAAATLRQLQAGALTAACVACLLSIPLVVIAVRRWTAPLRMLLAATQRLAQGQTPAPIAGAPDDDLGMLADSFNDMTAKLQDFRAQLQEANASLEDKVQQRTAELERAKRELESEISEKNEFLRAVSHDLGAPLRNIGGMAAMLLAKYKAVLADDALNKLERIGANVKAQTDLINDLLDLSRIRTRPGKRLPVDLHILVQELIETLAFDLDRTSITMEIRGRLPVIHADRNRLRQVFQNLLDNAIKYMLDARERRIIVACREEEETWLLSVSDTGRGIAEADLPQIFHLYRRATHSGSHQVPGRGVGLASVKTIVETYGGRIWVESRLGQGSTFHFTLDKRMVSPVPPVAVPLAP